MQFWQACWMLQPRSSWTPTFRSCPSPLPYLPKASSPLVFPMWLHDIFVHAYLAAQYNCFLTIQHYCADIWYALSFSYRDTSYCWLHDIFVHAYLAAQYNCFLTIQHYCADIWYALSFSYRDTSYCWCALDMWQEYDNKAFCCCCCCSTRTDDGVGGSETRHVGAQADTQDQALAVWVASNCESTPNDRTAFVAELMKWVRIDSYGRYHLFYVHEHTLSWIMRMCMHPAAACSQSPRRRTRFLFEALIVCSLFISTRLWSVTAWHLLIRCVSRQVPA